MTNAPLDLRRRWQPFVNNSGFQVPAYGCMKITASAAGVLTAVRPDGAPTSSAVYAFNGPQTVAAGRSGLCTQDFPCFAAYDAADGTPVNGGNWGPGNGTFKLRLASDGFLIVGDVNAANAVASVDVALAGGGAAPSAFSGCRVTKTGVQTIPGSGSAPVLFGTADGTIEWWDTDNYFNPAMPNRFTLPAAGRYRFSAAVQFEGLVNEFPGVRSIFFRTTNTARKFGRQSITMYGKGPSAYAMGCSSTVDADIPAVDAVELHAAANGAPGNQTISTATISETSYSAEFSVQRLT
jgi:hypothetical protein